MSLALAMRVGVQRMLAGAGCSCLAGAQLTGERAELSIKRRLWLEASLISRPAQLRSRAGNWSRQAGGSAARRSMVYVDSWRRREMCCTWMRAGVVGSPAARPSAARAGEQREFRAEFRLNLADSQRADRLTAGRAQKVGPLLALSRQQVSCVGQRRQACKWST